MAKKKAVKKVSLRVWIKWYKELKKWYDTYYGEAQTKQGTIPPPPPPPPNNPPA